MGNFLCDRNIFHAAITSSQVWTCAHVNTLFTHINLSPLQNNNTYKRFSLHIHFPAEPSAIRMLRWAAPWLKLIWSNVTIFHACGAVPGLTHPFQALSLSDLCSPPPSKTSIFGHLYMANIIHKHWDKQMHSHMHLLTHTIALTQHKYPSMHFLRICPKPQMNTNMTTSAHPLHAHAYQAMQKPNAYHAWVHKCCE